MTVEETLHAALSELPTLREAARAVLIRAVLRELDREGYRIVRDPTKPAPGPHAFAGAV